jgi:hypothetical protein
MTHAVSPYATGSSSLPDRVSRGGGPVSAVSRTIAQGRYDRALGRISYQLGVEVAQTTATTQSATVKVHALAHLGVQGVAAAGMLSDVALDVARRSPHAAPLLDRIYEAAGGGIVRVIENAADQVTR